MIQASDELGYNFIYRKKIADIVMLHVTQSFVDMAYFMESVKQSEILEVLQFWGNKIELRAWYRLLRKRMLCFLVVFTCFLIAFKNLESTIYSLLKVEFSSAFSFFKVLELLSSC